MFTVYSFKMKMWFLIFAVSSLTVSSQACPPGHFSAVFVTSIQQVVDDPRTFMRHDDPELTFFKSVMKFDDDEINYVTEDAIDFFNYTYGLDFSNSPPDEQNQRFLDNARMAPYRLRRSVSNFATANNWIRNGNTRSTCYRVRDGGFSVDILAKQTLYGKYGGDEGKPVEPPAPLVYGFVSIDTCEQSPVHIHIRCGYPMRTEPVDGTFIISDCYAFNRVLGRGKFQGIRIVRPARDNPKKYNIDIKNIWTFQAQEGRELRGDRDQEQRGRGGVRD